MVRQGDSFCIQWKREGDPSNPSCYNISMKIGIIGNYGATNVGDDAILSSILKAHAGHEFTVFSAHPKDTEKKFRTKTVPLFPLGFRSVFRHGFRQSIKALRAVDGVILGGGGLFQDHHLYACFLWAWQLFWVYFFEKPLFIYATGVGPLHSWLGKKLTAWAYSRAQVIAVRDESSRRLLKSLGLTEGEIHVTSDPVFLFHVRESLAERQSRLYMISLRPWLSYDSKIIAIFTEILLRLKTEKDARFLFVSMQEIKESDYKILNPLLKKTGGELFVPGNFSELIEKLRTAEFAIGMRFHFLIAALITQTPVIPISYSPKIDTLFDETPMERYKIPIGELSVDRLHEGLKRLSVDYNNVKVYEKARTYVLRDRAEESVRLFNRFIGDMG
ncbi:hypothetical protein COY07_03600 [Candidatus Peregrinibacteria bacterium CG_4_10_14_0_2_um_filter_43_11]|nr:MAG: hypothetical protein COY07_03600 [Candidatus Peregrinibacteria bacterium CG_4_10_14_0_2_um_filter_43_11]